MTNIKDNAIVQELLNKIAKQEAELSAAELTIKDLQKYKNWLPDDEGLRVLKHRAKDISLLARMVYIAALERHCVENELTVKTLLEALLYADRINPYSHSLKTAIEIPTSTTHLDEYVEKQFEEVGVVYGGIVDIGKHITNIAKLYIRKEKE
ncbi:MAG TPA: hypothetical protein VIM16_05755 [Mucilaginibacter sp.]|jgi:hypothetical protein